MGSLAIHEKLSGNRLGSKKQEFESRKLSNIMIARILFGKTGFSWLIIGAISAVALSAVEYLVVLVLQLILRNLGLEIEIPLIEGTIFTRNHSMLVTMFLLVSVGVIRSLGIYYVQLSGFSLREIVSARLRRLCVNNMLFGKGDQYNLASKTSSYFGEIIPKAASFMTQAVNLVTMVVQIAFLTSGLLIIAPREAFIGITGLGFIACYVLVLNKKVRAESAHLPRLHENLLAGVERVCRNSLFLEISRLKEIENDRLRSEVNNYERFAIGASSVAAFGTTIPVFLGILMLGLIIVLSQSYFSTPAGGLIAFLYLFLRFIQQVSAAANFYGNLNTVYPHLSDSVQTIIKSDQSSLDRIMGRSQLKFQESLNTGKAANRLPPAIEIDSARFSWESSGDPVLDNVSLKIEPGNLIGIRGASGSGKSTLINLILGVLDPGDGKVTIDGMSPVDYVDRNSDKIGYVGARPFLIEGTIFENLTYGAKKTYTDDEIKVALKNSSLSELIDKLPGGLDYRLTEEGEGLSAGQQQRISIARAFLKSPILLVLDEASSNLDVDTEADISRCIKLLEGKCTTIIVSHREGFLMNTKDIVDMAIINKKH